MGKDRKDTARDACNYTEIIYITTAYNPDSAAPAYSNRPSLTVNGIDEETTRNDWEAAGRENDIHDYKALAYKAANAVSHFDTYANDAGIDAKPIESIQAGRVQV